MFKIKLDFANHCLYRELDEIPCCFIFCDVWELLCDNASHKTANCLVNRSFFRRPPPPCPICISKSTLQQQMVSNAEPPHSHPHPHPNGPIPIAQPTNRLTSYLFQMAFKMLKKHKTNKKDETMIIKKG